MYNTILKIIIRNIKLKFNDFFDIDIKNIIIKEYLVYINNNKDLKNKNDFLNNIDEELFNNIENIINIENRLEITKKLFKKIIITINNCENDNKCNLLKNIINILNNLKKIIDKHIKDKVVSEFSFKLIKKIIKNLKKYIIC